MIKCVEVKSENIVEVDFQFDRVTSKFSPSDFQSSQRFFFHDQEWSVELCPNGYNSKSANFSHAFVCLEKFSRLEPQPTISVSFSILNQHGRPHLNITHARERFQPTAKTFGKHNLLLFEDLMNS